MLKDKKILFFGTNNEISITIVESLIKQNAIVTFISQKEIKNIDLLKRISKIILLKIIILLRK